MAPASGRVLLRSPRALGIQVALFIGLFALDAFGEGQPLRQELSEFVVHPIPAGILLAVVAASSDGSG